MKKEIMAVLVAVNSSPSMCKYPCNTALADKLKDFEAKGLITFDKTTSKWRSAT
jgi:hypothetical protein